MNARHHPPDPERPRAAGGGSQQSNNGKGLPGEDTATARTLQPDPLRILRAHWGLPAWGC